MAEPIGSAGHWPAAFLRPVRTGNGFEETVERLLQIIKLGAAVPGERLPAERELAGQLQVSRETLREAIAALRDAGYLASRRGRGGGTFVVRATTRRKRGDLAKMVRELGPDLEDVLKLRHVLEPGATELAAAEPLARAARARLAGLLAQVEQADAVTYRVLDSKLHLAIAELSGSASLAAEVAAVRMRVNDLLDAMPLLETNLAHSNRQHAQIVAAVLDGAPDRARSAMLEHLRGTSALIRGFLT